MALASANEPNETSALLNLELKGFGVRSLSEHEILEAVRHDIRCGLPLSRVAMLKYCKGNNKLSSESLSALLVMLKTEIVNRLELEPDVALSYTHAAIVCLDELRMRAA